MSWEIFIILFWSAPSIFLIVDNAIESADILNSSENRNDGYLKDIITKK
jgi:hypothetical protein